jgi:uncharacterized protein YndB with AHSA1/START domain
MADETAFEITRVFDAPREVIWREWTEPERFADWYGGAEAEIPLDEISMDVRPGGAWRATMYFGPNRREIQWHGEYVEIDEPERLVLTITDLPEAEADQYAFVTVVLNDLGDGRTEMQFEQRGPLPPEQVEPARKGWGKFFDRIDARLAEA